MLVDLQGRRTGKDPTTGTLYHEIPGTSYDEVGSATTNGAGELFTSDLPNGQYALYVLGGQTGRYWLDASHYGQQDQTFRGTIQADSMVAYIQTMTRHILQVPHSRLLEFRRQLRVSPPPHPKTSRHRRFLNGRINSSFIILKSRYFYHIFCDGARETPGNLTLYPLFGYTLLVR